MYQTQTKQLVLALLTNSSASGWIRSWASRTPSAALWDQTWWLLHMAPLKTLANERTRDAHWCWATVFLWEKVPSFKKESQIKFLREKSLTLPHICRALLTSELRCQNMSELSSLQFLQSMFVKLLSFPYFPMMFPEFPSDFQLRSEFLARQPSVAGPVSCVTVGPNAWSLPTRGFPGFPPPRTDCARSQTVPKFNELNSHEKSNYFHLVQLLLFCCIKLYNKSIYNCIFNYYTY